MKIPEHLRIPDKRFGIKGDDFGSFAVESLDKSRVTRTVLVIIASSSWEERGIDWEHVSVRAEKQIGARVIQMLPTWTEMNFVKSLFWDDEEVVVRFHPKRSEYVNNHPFVLHLWRYKKFEIPTPPRYLV